MTRYGSISGYFRSPALSLIKWANQTDRLDEVVEHNALIYNKSVVYPVDLVIPHEKAELLIAFSDRFIDGPYELGIYHQSHGECWGIANFRIETLEKGWDATEEELDACLAALFETDGKKVNAARWRLVAAGRKTVDALAK